jgi:hypothetical protein
VAVETARSGRVRMGAKMGKNCCGGNCRAFRNAAAADLPRVRAFPEGAVAGGRRSPLSFHSITSSASASSVGGMSRPSVLAVLRLSTNSNLVAIQRALGRVASVALRQP